MCAQLPVPPEMEVHPVNADGVAGLRLSVPLADGPTILYAHGGGMALGSAYGHRAIAAALAVASGTATVVPDYRLAPEHPDPAAVDDIQPTYPSPLRHGRLPQPTVLAGHPNCRLALRLVLR